MVRAQHPVHPEFGYFSVAFRPTNHIVPVAVPDQVIRGKAVELAAMLWDLFFLAGIFQVLKLYRLPLPDGSAEKVNGV